MRSSLLAFATLLAAACGSGDPAPADSSGTSQTSSAEKSGSVAGTPGPDQFLGTSEPEAFEGGDGFDYVRYDGLTVQAGVTASLRDPSGNTGDAAGDTFASIEGLAGSRFDDLIEGDDRENDLHGLTGMDSIVGGGGPDVLGGGPGVDSLDGGGGADTFLFEVGEANGDRIVLFEGAGAPGGDRIVFIGFGPDATLRQDGPSLLIVYGSKTETVAIESDGVPLTQDDYAFE